MDKMEELELSSRSYFLWNNTSGLVVSERDAEVQTPVASLTKIMTALLTLERRQLDEVVTITPEMVQGLDEFAVVGLQVGQQLTVEELLYATMLPSAGDAAQALAVNMSGSIAGFADLMNAKAAELGMAQTHFSNPVGMDEENYSTPRDIARLLREALKNSTFVEIFEAYEKELPTLGRTVRKTFDKTEYIKGGKTGYTEAAGRCLASTAEVEGMEYILVTIGALPGQNVVDAGKIYRQVEQDYEPKKIVSLGETLVRVGVKGSATKTLEFPAEREVVVTLANDASQAGLQYDYEGVTTVTRETEPGAKLGVVTIRQGENTLYTQDLYYQAVPEFYNYGWVALEIEVIVGAILMIVGALVWRRKQKHERRAWWLLGAGVILLFVSLIVGVFVFRPWFAPAGETEVLKPEIVEATEKSEIPEEPKTEEPEQPEQPTEPKPAEPVVTTGNCTLGNGNLMLINPNFTVDETFIANRRGQLVSISQLYGIPEYHRAGNGDNLMMPEAAQHLNEMLVAYREANPGHEMGTYSCFRARGTLCGRLCAATGASDHHTGLTCDLIDLAYGSVLDTDDYPAHWEWQWLKENSYKYGFIDRFPEAWAGGPMSEPLNVDANGSTGLYETWHYRYVGVTAATEIATGKYNNGQYDSLEHYLKMTGRVGDLKAGTCK